MTPRPHPPAIADPARSCEAVFGAAGLPGRGPFADAVRDHLERLGDSGLSRWTLRRHRQVVRRLARLLEASGVTDWRQVGDVELSALAADRERRYVLARLFARLEHRGLVDRIPACLTPRANGRPPSAATMAGPEALVRPVLDYLEDCRAVRRHAPATVATYRHQLARLVRFVDGLDFAEWGEVTPATAGAYLVTLGRHAHATAAQARSACAGFFRWLESHGGIAADPFAGMGPMRPVPRRLPRVLTAHEVARLMTRLAFEVTKARAADAGDVSRRTALLMRDRALLELAYAAGLRSCELIGLERRAVDFGERTVRVLGKGSRERVVPFGRPAAAALSDYLEHGRPELSRGGCDRVFLNGRGGPLSRMGVHEIVRSWCWGSGVEGQCGSHTLRHTCATHLLRGGADLRVVQELLGHRSLATTQIYVHLDRGDLRAAYDRCFPRAHAREPGATSTRARGPRHAQGDSVSAAAADRTSAR